MRLLRNLADQGRTIAVITHATKNVMLADKVLFMVPGGRIAWYGPPSEALAYFDRFRTAEERADRAMEFDEIYKILDDPSRGGGEDWAARYAEDDARTRYISGPLRLDDDGKPPTTEAVTPEKSGARASSSISQLMTLSLRNLKLLARDRFALILMLAAAPALAGLDFLITSRNMFDAVTGDATRIITTTNAMIVNAMLVAALSQMREIVKERDIYRRERLVNLGIAPYILSKVWVAAVIAIYQAMWWVGIRYLAVDMPGGFDTLTSIYVTMMLVTFAGMMLGLFASAITPSEGSVALLVALIIVPQVLFSGSHLPVHKTNVLVQQQMDIMPSRWAFEALISAGGHGKQATEAACQGASILTECSFPGIQGIASSAQAELSSDEPAVSTETAVTLAEGQLAVHVDSYGPIYDINVATRWLALLLISVGLTGGLLGVQLVRERR